MHEIDSSYGNLIDPTIPTSPFITFDSALNILKEAGYRGFEWHFFRSLANVQLEFGRIGSEARDSISSVHQSYRSEKDIFEALRYKNKGLAVVSYVALPERVRSLRQMFELQTKLGRWLPAVLYPAHIGENEPTEEKFAEKLFQPTQEVMKAWKVKNVSELIAESKRRGYDGFCLDLSHMRSSEVSEFTLEPWREKLPELLPFTKEIHVSAGRIDMPYHNTLSELKDLVYGTKHTELVAMLKLITESNFKGRIVTEIPARALKILLDDSAFSLKNLTESHREIVYNLKVLLTS